MLLTADPEGVYLLGWRLPESCVLKRVTGHDCLGCGLTRSFVYMGHLDLAGAFARHWLGPALWGFTAAQIPYRAWRLLAQRAGKGPI